MDRKRIRTCTEIREGDAILAHYGTVLQFAGLVTLIQADHKLFWAVDSLGCRRLIDLGSYNVFLSSSC
jgi:hypothetical protein